MNYTVIMKRTYETAIVIEAQTEAEAIAIAESSPNRYAEELEQCNVIEESYCIEGPVEAPIAGVWEFVEAFYPGYINSGQIAIADELQKIVDKEDEEGSCARDYFMHDCHEDMNEVLRQYEFVHHEIYKKAIESYIESLKNK